MTVRELKREFMAAGNHFFDESAMRFFNSRVEGDPVESADGGRVYFVTSEQYDEESPRLFTVRVWARDAGRASSVSAFQAYDSRDDAMRAMDEGVRS